MARRSLSIRAAVPLAALAALAAGAQPAGPIHAASAEEILAALGPALAARLHDEKVLVLDPDDANGGPSAKRVHALVLFALPRNEVLRFLIQNARQREFRPELRRAEPVEELASGQVVEYEIRMMLMRVRYRARHAWDFQRGHTWWSLDPDFDNDLAALEGRWEVFALGSERTLGRVGTRIDVGPALPVFLQDFATRQKLPEAMHNLRRWIDSGGTYRP